MARNSSEINIIQKKIWEGSLPLEIRLSPSECRSFDQSDLYLVHYPRISYFPFLLERLKAFFTPFLIQPDVPAHDGWLSFEGVPLKWHYPVGLLYDLFSGADPTNSKGGGGAGQESGDEISAFLPWKLELHFTDWPDEQLVRLDNDGRVMHDAFINSVKETILLPLMQ
ncbi:autophagy protein 5 [Glutinoglossum americanum]|uniref:Autophagy protein 5 n=1 Tax=Glutinoglossum americanum TaxID=1670608 RepID=A0A9P8L4U3_9PEZI|nr:autophagy protein 5 [Glutinoglossum americanum]